MHILVTGGAGMLGSALIRALKQDGHVVKSLDLELSPGHESDSLVADIRDAAAVRSACAGMDAVVHTIARVNQLPIKDPLMYAINVQGTRNVIEACQSVRVPRLVYVSSVDVVFDGTPIVDGDETLPYPKRHLDYYGETKVLAEQAVIAANGVNGVATCSLRSSGLYGPGDRHRFPNVIPRTIESGRYTIIGDGQGRFNHLYVDNMAHACKLAVERLSLDSPLAGECYFITDHEASNFFAFFKPYLDALGIQYRESRLPEGLAMLLARAAEQLYRWRGGKPPLLSR
ncbi:MAG: NAD-dependent epimerase/dehydratase family protein, partial [Anaerolineae bacterium]|nr:NAD-dependent epimerase/dehydratase family protein [Anaerolineae bacterium]